MFVVNISILFIELPLVDYLKYELTWFIVLPKKKKKSLKNMSLEPNFMTLSIKKISVSVLYTYYLS